jgi:uroporphyrin-III C-methyltransferase
MPPEPKLGRVLLAGAGPGAADLMTVRAMRAVQSAQALLYDALVSGEVLALAPSACLKIQTGKRAGRASMTQDTINRLMLRLARRGLDVVRLKGGDPAVFGRVGEEAAFLREHGIEVEIVPGVTAASAAAAQFGLPLTHRGEARRLVFSTARLETGALQADWAPDADPEATLCVYMGRDEAAAVAQALIARGLPALTPCLAVENAGRPDAAAYPAVLQTLGDVLRASAPTGPVVLLIGRVAARAVLDVAMEEPARRSG